jgi:hypothetical protein
MQECYKIGEGGGLGDFRIDHLLSSSNARITREHDAGSLSDPAIVPPASDLAALARTSGSPASTDLLPGGLARAAIGGGKT